MKLTTIVLAAVFALPSTFALAQAGLSGYGSTVAPSVGSYTTPSVGSYVNETPTWSTTGPAAPMPSPMTAGSAFPTTVAPMSAPSRSAVAATAPTAASRR
jgi:hypothetical protein